MVVVVAEVVLFSRESCEIIICRVCDVLLPSPQLQVRVRSQGKKTCLATTTEKIKNLWPMMLLFHAEHEVMLLLL